MYKQFHVSVHGGTELIFFSYQILVIQCIFKGEETNNLRIFKNKLQLNLNSCGNVQQQLNFSPWKLLLAQTSYDSKTLDLFYFKPLQF